MKEWSKRNFRKMLAAGTGILLVGGTTFFFNVEEVRTHYDIITVTNKFNDTIPGGNVVFDTIGCFDSIYIPHYGEINFGERQFKDTVTVIIRSEFWHNEHFRVGAIR